MFSKAYETASKFTQPVLISHRFFNKDIESGLGSFIIINEEGWILTAAHIIESLYVFRQHAQEMQAYKQKKQVVTNPRWITNLSHWWGKDSHRIREFQVFKENDIAIGRIDDFDPSFCKGYPVFRDPSGIRPGTSVCKLGFPFFNVKASFNQQTHAFHFDRSIFPIPRFPIDGMLTRNLLGKKSEVHNLDVKFIETSSPGLRGQSGGPIFDTEGRVVGIQSHTRHLPLGFSPKIKKGDQEVEENQFLNVGIGAHVQSILAFLNKFGVKYEIG